MAEPLDVVLHVGAHKTASTHLQQCLGQNADLLAEFGTPYYGPGFLRRPDRNVRKALGRHLVAAKAELQIRRLAKSHQRILISEENFIGPLVAQDGAAPTKDLYPIANRRINRLAGDLSPHRLHIAMAIRNPATFLISAYSQALMSGRFLTWNEFQKGVYPATYDWRRVLGPLARNGRCASILVWAYEDYHEVFPKVLDQLIGEGRPELQSDLSRKRHEGLSAAAVAACEQWHNEGYTGLLGQIAREDFPVSDENPAFRPWAAARMERSRKAYLNDLDAIAALPGVTLLRGKATKG